MANRPVSSSERKGVLVVAAIALVVTLMGLGVAWCGRPEQAIAPDDVEVLVRGDSVLHDTIDSLPISSDSVARRERRGRYNWSRDTAGGKDREQRVKKKKGKERLKKEYGRRSPLDERV